MPKEANLKKKRKKEERLTHHPVGIATNTDKGPSRVYMSKWLENTCPGFDKMVGKYLSRRTDHIDHDLDHLYPNLPLWDVVQDLYSADPTPEACPKSSGLFRSTPGNTELEHSDHADHTCTCPAWQISNW